MTDFSSKKQDDAEVIGTAAAGSPSGSRRGTVPSSGSSVGFDQAEAGIDQILENTRLKLRQGTGTGVADHTEIDKVIKDILKQKNLVESQENYNRILCSCALHCQQGATSPKYADSRMVVEYGISLKVSEMRAALKAAGITARKFARGIRNVIIKVAKSYLVEGNLSKAYKLENPNFDQQDLVWVSDFQTFNEDPAMPVHVKEWLLDNYRRRFRPNSTASFKQQQVNEGTQE
jgi:hypothetical protein